MSSIAYRALVAEGDRWLDQATGTYQGGGDFTVAAAEAAIASAHYARAALEKPDTFASLMGAAAAAKNAPAAPGVDADVEAAVARHPAGKQRPPDPPPRVIRDQPQA